MASPAANDDDIDRLLNATYAEVGESPAVVATSARLQAMIDAARKNPQPLVDPRTLPVRFTRLKQFALSPAHYLASCQGEIDESLALRLGSATHAGLFLDRPVVCFDGRRAGKDWAIFEAHWLERRAVILNEREYRLAAGVIDAVKRHERAMELLFDDTVREETLIYQRGDRAARATPDARGRRRIVELKTTRCGEPRTFTRDGLRRYYHCQVASYARAAELDGGEMFVVVVENVEPYNVVVWRISDRARLAAEKLNTLWWEQLTACEAAGQYPGYVEDDIEFDVPELDQITFGGEPVFVDAD